jgi:hypothetical protein
MSLIVDFTSVPRLIKGDFRLPTGDFIVATPARAREDLGHTAADGEHLPSYRLPDCIEALHQAFADPLSGMFSPGLV